MRSGRLVVIGFHHKSKSNHVFVECVCDCGKHVVVRASSIVKQESKSCGCLARELTKKRLTKHGMFGSRIYNIWAGLRRRCYDSNVSGYKWYGGKGIGYCKEWDSFENFYEWAKKSGYKDSLSIDRIDYNKGYSPENCRWVDKFVQARNKKSNVVLTYKNESFCCSEWAEILGINYSTLLSRKRRGFPVEEILFHKKRKHFFKRNQQHIKNITKK